MTTNHPAAAPELVSFADAAQMLGCSAEEVRRLAIEGTIAPVHIDAAGASRPETKLVGLLADGLFGVGEDGCLLITGQPTGRLSGGPVTPAPLGGWLRLELADILRYAQRSSAVQETNTIGVAAHAARSNVTHKISGRAGALDAVIETARINAVDPSDWQSVWASLVKTAQGENRPPPLLGYVEREGVKYECDSESGIKFLTKNAMRMRASRSKRPTKTPISAR